MNKKTKELMLEHFRSLGRGALTMTHYDLSDSSDFTAEEWKVFLKEPEVEAWVGSEIALINKVELQRLIDGVADTNSVGKAQLINAMQKANETEGKKEGPAFIYCYIPPDLDQMKAENLEILDEDPFLVKINKINKLKEKK